MSLRRNRAANRLDTPAKDHPRAQRHWDPFGNIDIALNGAFATGDQTAFLDAWQSVDSDDVSAIASATAEGVPLADAKKAFGKDPKEIIEELNEALIA